MATGDRAAEFGRGLHRKGDRNVSDERRIDILDSFRAIAILLVIGFHYFTRWTPPHSPTNFYPYGGDFANFVLFRYGYLGVELFFVISGFVISLTLFRSRSLADFAWKRFARLFPAMLLCSTVTFLVVTAVASVPVFARSARDFLPSLTFTDPIIWEKVLGGHFSAIDGSYWSLFVEVKFYFWISTLFFLVGAPRFFKVVTIAFPLLVVAAGILQLTGSGHVDTIRLLFALDYLPWFIAGIGFFSLYSDQSNQTGYWLLVESALSFLASAAWTPVDLLSTYASLAVFYALFASMIFRPSYLSWMAGRFLSRMGAASYSLYLLHQNIGVTLLASFSTFANNRPWTILLAPCVAILLIFASLAIYRYWEMPAKNVLTRFAKQRLKAALP